MRSRWDARGCRAGGRARAQNPTPPRARPGRASARNGRAGRHRGNVQKPSKCAPSSPVVPANRARGPGRPFLAGAPNTLEQRSPNTLEQPSNKAPSSPPVVRLSGAPRARLPGGPKVATRRTFFGPRRADTPRTRCRARARDPFACPADTPWTPVDTPRTGSGCPETPRGTGSGCPAVSHRSPRDLPSRPSQGHPAAPSSAPRRRARRARGPGRPGAPPPDPVCACSCFT